MEMMHHWCSAPPETSGNSLIMGEETENCIQTGSPKISREENTICFQITFSCLSYVYLLCRTKIPSTVLFCLSTNSPKSTTQHLSPSDTNNQGNLVPDCCCGPLPLEYNIEKMWGNKRWSHCLPASHQKRCRKLAASTARGISKLQVPWFFFPVKRNLRHYQNDSL